MYTSNGILFNHESPLRGEEFVTRKITSSVAKIKKGRLEKISLGNLNAKRDWGYAGDYVKAMYKMLQNDTPEDFVISTGITNTVRDFLKFAFNCVDIDIYFEGDALNEKGIDPKTGKILLDVSDHFYRPAEVDQLIGDSTKAKNLLNWSSETRLEEMIRMMVNYDLMLLSK
jgi:GDPmannose 4,6-dehydratase